MRRGRKFLTLYFVIVGIFSLIAMIPGGVLFLALITAMVLPLFGAGGFIAMAAPTVLLYSAALIPVRLALTAPRRNILRIAATALLPIVIALVPGTFSRQGATEFAMRMGKDDMRRQAGMQPKRIELIGDPRSGLFAYGQTVGDKDAPCNEICRRLLFNGEVAWV